MDNNNFAFNLQGVMAHAQGLIKSIEAGDGFNLTDDQKKEYEKQMKESGGFEKVDELKKQMEKLKDTVKQANGNHN